MIKIISSRSNTEFASMLEAFEEHHNIKSISVATTTVPKIGRCEDWTYIDVLYTAVVVYSDKNQQLLID